MTDVATQGRYGGSEYTRTYSLQYLDPYISSPETWRDVKENGEVKTFTGNSDTNTVKKNALPTEIYTRAIRFIPKSYSGGIALRVELYGYPAGRNVD